MPEFSVCSPAARDFSRVCEFLEHFRPLTPCGVDVSERFPVRADIEAIERDYDDTEVLLDFFGSRSRDGACLDRIAWHLRRIPRLPSAIAGGGSLSTPAPAPAAASDGEGVLEMTELFAVKKFIANYRAVSGLLDDSTRGYFSLSFSSVELSAALCAGGSDPETFHIADDFDPRLRQVRGKIRDLESGLAALRAGLRDEVKLRFGLDFGLDDFLLVAHASAPEIQRNREFFAISPYDDASWRVSLQPARGEPELESEREGLASIESQLENEVMRDLSRLAAAEAANLSANLAALTRFDLAQARARIALDFGLTRPNLRSVDGLEISGGRFLPCLWACEKLGLDYSPVDFVLREKAAVIFGSNMGGKTVILESLVFFQILAQAGFFVPANRFSSSVYPLIHCLGGLPSDSLPEGLSGFGSEIRSLVGTWEQSSGGGLVVFDEFARTTSSLEAEALISAVLEKIVDRPGLRGIFSSHFRGIRRIPGVRYLRVRGLDRAAAREAFGSGEAVTERIRRINRMMRYGVVDDSGAGQGGSDAVSIAALLGLDRDIVARAEVLYSRDGKD